MSLEYLFALQDGRHVKGANGDRIRQIPGGGTSLRPGNRELRDVPMRDRLLSLYCNADPRHPYLIVVMESDRIRLHDLSTEEEDGSIRTPCRCRARYHLLDPQRVENLAEIRAGMPPRQRRADVLSVVRETRG